LAFKLIIRFWKPFYWQGPVRLNWRLFPGNNLLPGGKGPGINQGFFRGRKTVWLTWIFWRSFFQTGGKREVFSLSHFGKTPKRVFNFNPRVPGVI